MLPDNVFSHWPFISSLTQRYSKGSSLPSIPTLLPPSAPDQTSPHGGHGLHNLSSFLLSLQPCLPLPPSIPNWTLPTFLSLLNWFSLIISSQMSRRGRHHEGILTFVDHKLSVLFALCIHIHQSFHHFDGFPIKCLHVEKVVLFKLRYIIHASSTCKILWLAGVQRRITHHSLTQRILS